MSGGLIWKLLRKHISLLQLIGFFLTNLVGVAIVLTAVQVYHDVRPVLDAPDSFMTGDYLVLSKQIEGAGIGKASFSPQELTDLAGQPFTVETGEFTSARYSVVGGISVMNAGMQTYLFFESVPDRFLDVAPDEWRFTEGDRVIPIILPRNYLNLYNFGFASTQGLPQVSEELVQGINLTIDLSGRGRHERFTGRIVAFSNRLNTILVPDGFIRWSNERFADKLAGDPSRIIVEVRNPADEQLQKYLKEHDYRIEGDDDGASQTGYFLRMATLIVSGVGLLITALSFFILMLSIFLLLQKNTRKFEDLLMLGYTPARVSRPYQLLSLGLNLLALLAAIPVIIWTRAQYLPRIESLYADYVPPGIGTMLLVGMVIVVLVSVINAVAIRRKVNALWVQK